MPKFAVGQRVWIFDENSREYSSPAKGRTFGDLIYESHFVAMMVYSIEKRVYVIGTMSGNLKKRISFAKAEKLHRTDQEKQDMCFVDEHRYRLARFIDACRDASILRSVAKVIGYKVGGA